ncbi:recombinase family protein [Thiomicrorhabdus sediminis]|uniref:Recombinase family protein n=1 Tax=Thiomicrorhabdus sediminis TaxID=2580412 RepID=A0A4P9K8D8_9GAMM|nr:recombinase family protein [Thiomicrorhabdus sediminis]QCU90547.1 recombinase family protein [Thiomicrorhabdus sediminis]
MTDPIKYVTYYRVSTKKQGDSGLGLDAQRRDIQLFLDNYSGVPYEVLAEFVEVESGANAERKELSEAIALAKKEAAILLVAKLDRLSRKVSFVSSLMDDKGLNLKVAQMPNADKFQLHIYAALAEQERDFISKRTKAALAEAKARGQKLGGLRDKTNERNKAKRKVADDFAAKFRGILSPMVSAQMSLEAIATALNEAGHKTAQGKTFKAMTVKRLLDRLNLKE